MTNSSIINLTNHSFEEEVLKSELPVLVDFWAEWCGPCKAIAPILDELAIKYAGKVKFTKLNVDEHQATSIKYSVRSIPTLILFKDGTASATKSGALPKSQLEAFLDKHLA